MVKSVNIFVLNWKGRDLTLDCLESLKKISYQNANVVVIDNGSNDDSVSSIKNKYPEIDLIELPENLGFAGGNNTGFKSVTSKTDYSIFLNNDTLVDPHFVEPLIAELEQNPSVKQSAPKIFYADNPDTIWFAGGIVSLWTGLIRHIGIRRKDSMAYSKTRKIDYATGCCVAMRTNDFESIGMFDESFPMYAEDVDLSLRFRELGGGIAFTPKSKVWHKVSASVGGQYSFEKWKRKIEGKIKLLAKHSKPYQIPFSLSFALIISVVELLFSIILRIGQKQK